jgi:2-dehydropantoate 2-reductase
MRVAIMGAGAIGLLYGGWLQQGGADVTFIARGQRLKSLRNSPLRAQGRLPFKLDRVTALECPKSTEPVDVVLLCVKLYDVEQAATFALPALKPGGTLIGIQNGVNVLDLLKPLLPARQLAVGSVYSVAKLLDPTTATYGGLERVVIGNPESDISEDARELLRIWQSVGVDASYASDIRSILWQKFIGVATGSAINCLTRLPAGIVYHDQSLLVYVRQAIDEVIAVGRAAGVTLPPGAAENTLAFLKTFPFGAVASMRLDLDAGRKLELEGLSGEVARLGKLLSVPTPFHQMAYDMLRPFRDGPARTA